MNTDSWFMMHIFKKSIFFVKTLLEQRNIYNNKKCNFLFNLKIWRKKYIKIYIFYKFYEFNNMMTFIRTLTNHTRK